MVVLCCGMPQGRAAGRATEILEKLAAGFRAMPGYSVDFEVSAGDYKSRGSYVVEGRCYYLVLADAEVFADSVVRYEIDNRRREVTVTEVDAASRNILNNPVRAFDFLGSEYIPALVSEAGARRRAADARRRERLSGGQRHRDGRYRRDASSVALLRLRRRAGAGRHPWHRAARWTRPALRPEELCGLRIH